MRKYDLDQGKSCWRWGIHTIYMQDVEQGEPQSQVLFRVTFLQCITLARQTLHHKSATYQQRHHEAVRLPDPATRWSAPASARPPRGSFRRIRTGEPAATGAGRRGGTVPEETSVMPAAAAVRGITSRRAPPARATAGVAFGEEPRGARHRARSARLPGPDDPGGPDRHRRPTRPIPPHPTPPVPRRRLEQTITADRGPAPPPPSNDPPRHTRETHSNTPRTIFQEVGQSRSR